MQKNFDGKRFYNQVVSPRPLRDILQWLWQRQKLQWPNWVTHKKLPPPAESVEGDTLVITYINHATLLIQTAGLNILTDPVWSKRIGPLPGIGIKRVCDPGLAFELLPRIDYILISHNHYDHLDLPTLKRLVKRDNPKLFCGLKVDRILDFATVEALDWWEEQPLSSDIQLHFVPAQHFSGRGLHDRDQTLWGGFVIQAPGGPIYFAGDTGFGPHFQAIREKFGAMRVALLPIGAYEPTWFMGSVHVSPSEAVKAHKILDANLSIGIHFGTFHLADDAYDAPMTVLAESLKTEGVAFTDFKFPDFGEQILVNPKK